MEIAMKRKEQQTSEAQIEDTLSQLIKKRRISGHPTLMKNFVIALAQLPAKIQQQVMDDDSLVIVNVGFGLEEQIIAGVYINHNLHPKKHMIVFDGCALSQMRPEPFIDLVAEEIAHYVLGRSAPTLGSAEYVRNEKEARKLVTKWLKGAAKRREGK
jgi:hypothetical protein